jgi:hypothetical protein
MPVTEELAMKSNELKQALLSINKVSADSRVGTVQRDQLLRAKRELTAVARSGRLDRQRVFLAIELVAAVLVQIVDTEAKR